MLLAVIIINCLLIQNNFFVFYIIVAFYLSIMYIKRIDSRKKEEKMDIRVLKYFLATVDKGSLAKAADSLLTTAPNISRQISDLESELGTSLFRKEGRHLVLTEDGRFLKTRAKEIVSLAERTENDIKTRSQELSGSLFIGAAETPAMRKIAPVIASMTTAYPAVTCRFRSGDADFVTDGLDNGMLDFGILAEPADIKKYGHIKLPVSDQWGLLMREDHPLARLPSIRPEDLIGVPLMCSEQMLAGNGLSGWMGQHAGSLRFVLTYNLITTAAMMAEGGVGCALTFKDLVYTQERGLCFRGLNPRLETGLYLVWLQERRFSRIADVFFKRFQDMFQPSA